MSRDYRANFWPATRQAAVARRVPRCRVLAGNQTGPLLPAKWPAYNGTEQDIPVVLTIRGLP